MPQLDQLSQQLDRLAAFEPGPFPVVSLYLNLQADGRGKANVDPFLKKEFAERLRTYGAEAPERGSLENDRQKIVELVDSRSASANGLVVFSSSGADLFEAIQLSAPIDEHKLFINDRPHLYPLAKLMDQYPRYLVLLADTHSARIFVIAVNAVERTERIENPKTKHHKMGGWSQARYQRHHEAHVYSHLKTVAQRLADLHRRRRFERLILAGPEEAATELQRVLPRMLARRVVAVIPADIDAGVREILGKTLAVERRIEREEEERLLRQLVDLAGPGGRSVLGVRPTLVALWADLVQTLVVAQGARGEGAECPNCERLDPGRVERCPTCGSTMRHVHDVFHRAAQRAVERAGRAEIVYGDAERRLLELGGGLGALLRSPSPVPQAVS